MQAAHHDWRAPAPSALSANADSSQSAGRSAISGGSGGVFAAFEGAVSYAPPAGWRFDGVRVGPSLAGHGMIAGYPAAGSAFQGGAARPELADQDGAAGQQAAKATADGGLARADEWVWEGPGPGPADDASNPFRAGW